MPAAVWSTLRQRQPTGKRISQRPVKSAELVIFRVYWNVARGGPISKYLRFRLHKTPD